MARLLSGCAEDLSIWSLQSRPDEWMTLRLWVRLGYEPEAFEANRSFVTLIVPETLAASIERLARFRAEPTNVYRTVMAYWTQTGGIAWIQWRGCMVDDRREQVRPHGGSKFVIAYEDVTWLRSTELALIDEPMPRIAELEAGALELERANRQLSTFAYSIAHDLKAPLRGISTCVGWLQDQLPDTLSADAQENLKFIRHRTARMIALVNGALEFAKSLGSSGETEAVDTRTIVDELLVDHDRERDRIVVEGEWPLLLYIPADLSRVLQNLLDNAIRYSPADASIVIAGHQIDGFVRFEVRDRGPGVAPEQQKRIFDLFVSLDGIDDGASTGIGLSISKAIVERHGGTIGVDSDGENGSTFWFTVPRVAPTSNGAE